MESADQPITVTSTPSGMSLTVDGIPCTAPCSFQWIQGSPHTVAVATPQAGAAGTQYAFANWSDGGTASHSISAPGAATTYTAAFITQYLLTTVANPASAGTISPGSAFFNSGASFPVAAVANSTANFSAFTGALSGSTTPQPLTLNGPSTVTANFTVTPDFAVNFNDAQNLYPLYINPNGGSVVPVAVNRVGGFANSVSLAISGLPANYFVLSGSNLIIQVPSGAPPTQYTVTATGTSGSLIRSAQFTLSVNGTGPSFGVGVNPGVRTVTAGDATSYAVSVNPSGGFTGTVGLNVQGLPPGSSYGFSPASVVTQGVSTLSVTTPSNASGTYFLTITGSVSNGPTSSTSATLVVNAPGGPPLQTITTFPPGLSLTVDGAGCVSPCRFQWRNKGPGPAE